MSLPLSLRISSLRNGYRKGELTPGEVLHEVYERIAANTANPAWIQVVERAQAMARARELESDSAAALLPLYGIPFAVKDNIDVAGLPTTAGCSAYAYKPERTATAVQRLLDNGAILIGKTNLDQFATGLVGVRSPYGECRCVFDDQYISGGSSSGSAVAVALGLVSFALGTDTAGSGRVPAAFNNIVGFKPTRGIVSASGVVPACRSLDCVSIFTLDSADARDVIDVAASFDPADPYSRPSSTAPAPWIAQPRIGVPLASQLEFFGDAHAPGLFAKSAETLRSLGAEIVEIDYAPFRAAAELLYSGPSVAERLAAIEPFIKAHRDQMHPVVASIIGGADCYSAVDAFRAAYRLRELALECDEQWKRMDVMLLPTTGTIYTRKAVEADPVRLNSNLGYYTNFVNLLDLSAVAVPAGFRDNRLPFGVTLIGHAFADRALLTLASRLHGALDLPLGATRDTVATSPALPQIPFGCVPVAVVGAHLTGQPLNHELTSRQARLLKTCRTAPDYRFYALRNTTPPKPGLVREVNFAGTGIEVEVWAVPEREFGSFAAGVPPPLAIGSLLLEDGTTVKGFVCEPFAVEGSREITEFGGWRNWLAANGKE